MKQIIAITALVLFSLGIQAQNDKDTTWKSGTSGTINFSQVTLSNWAAGGQNSYSAEGQFDFFTKYNKEKTTWLNTLNLAYGLVKIEKENMKKSNDLIDFESKLGYAASPYWDYSLMYNFRTQFAPGYNYDAEPRSLISEFMAPGYMTLAAGMDYQPNDYLSVFLSPFSAKATIVTNDSLSADGAYGVEPGNTTFYEYGAIVKVKFEKEVMKNINFGTKADFFSAYNNNPENIDVNWEVNIKMKVNKYLTTTLRTHLIYDHDVKIANAQGVEAPRVQFKEAFGFGIAYNFPAKEE